MRNVLMGGGGWVFLLRVPIVSPEWPGCRWAVVVCVWRLEEEGEMRLQCVAAIDATTAL